jgi:hypothetical protein
METGDAVLKNVPPELRTMLLWTVGAGVVSVLLTQLQTRPWLIGLAVVVIAGVYGYGRLQRQRNAVAGNGSVDGSPAVASRWANVWPRMRWAVGVGGCAVVIGVVALVWYRHVTSQPSKDAVKGGLAAALAPLPVTIPTIDFVNVTQLGELGCRITYQAVVETTAPLYRRTDTSTYLYGHAAAELRTIDAAEVLLRGTEGARLLAATGAAAPTRVRDVVLLETQTQAPARAMANGMLVAWRRDGAWTFTIEQSGVDRTRLAGDPKPAGDAVFVVDVPADAARLNALIAENVAYARRVIAAAEQTATSRSEPNQTAADRSKPGPTASSRIEPRQAAADGAESEVVVGPRSREPSTGETPVPHEPNTGETPVPRQAAGSATKDRPAKPTQRTFPTERGAYVLDGDDWWRLPTNNGHFLEKRVPDDLAEQFDDVYRAAGWMIEESKRVLGDLAFDGSDPVPTVAMGEVVILYVGNLPGDAAGYPSIEVTALRMDPNGTRFTPLTREAPTIRGFGVRRVPATLDRPISDRTVLHCSVSLAAGRYAVSCGGQFFEFAVK